MQIATDHAKGATARLSGREVPKYEDDETSFDELKARIAKTLDFVKSVPAGESEGSESREIKLTIGGQERTLSGERYLARVVLPNFFFHVTTAYTSSQQGRAARQARLLGRLTERWREPCRRSSISPICSPAS